jgi:S1-C subfamily serine protease
MSDSDPTDHQPAVPPPWPTARPGEPTPPSSATGPLPAPPAADPTQPTPTFAAPAPPPWPASEPQPARPTRGRTTALVAVVGVVALLAGAAGAAVGVAVSDRSGGGTSPSSFVAPSNPFGNGNGGSSEGGQLGGGTDSGSTGNVNIDVSGIAKKVNPAIVNIETTLSGGGEAAGTGMVLTSSGEVLTNNHVINGATRIRAEVGITGKTYTAKVVGYDAADDVALIKLDNASGMKTIATETSVSKNDKVVAIGNALGRFGTPSAVGGTVSALHQKVTAGDGGDSETLSDMIRIAASIQPGDSGGALVNESGKVIGMNTAADSGAGQSPFGGQFGSQTGTTGFAIPIGNAIKVVDEIRDGDTSNGAHIGDRALLGVVLEEPSSNSPFGDDTGNGSNGAAVSDVSSGSPADNAGIQPGDTITAVGSKSVDSADQLRTLLNGYHPGDKVTITWTDDSGTSHHASVTLTKGPPA